MSRIIKIVAIGPECTGKSTLSEDLAAYYKTGWCPEFAREYLLTHGMNYSFEDLLLIARGQLDLEDKITAAHQPGSARESIPLFIDTDMYVMKVWCEFVFGKCHRYILDEIVKRKYDHYLLCSTDLPWVKDELREYPDLESRQKLFSIYKDILVNQSVPWTVVSGNREQRLKIAITATDKLLQSA